MQQDRFLIEGDAPGRPTVLLAHGAGASMESDFMNRIAAEMARAALCVVRFEFAYMAARRAGGSKRPPPRVDALRDEFAEAVAALDRPGPLIIGGKSMGGRVASLVADGLFAAGRVAGLLCLGYPFHPAGKPMQLRTAHLEAIEIPTLICQGTRDPFGNRGEVESYGLSDRISLLWLEDGDHDLKPRKTVTGKAQDDHLRRAAQTTASWVADLARSRC